ncbi:NAD(P)-dependent oxidoreductase [Novosphingobium sp.]|uniref:NAD(P)-dependent oxidoreductase n=1 Tax=Novosphingobium sp. TaxID=1874826 RepID=UPI002B479CD8|nr:DUF1932 domain-containing protein [Novosphingobium sp.]HKR92427.1 DUF1932 domain-containing protein [Novosphingobium sp.]
MGKVALIGFGEAGSTFALDGGWGAGARAFDILSARTQAMRAAGITPCADLAEALTDAPLVLSLVTADAALGVARAAAELMAPGALFCDMNSVAPETKRSAAHAIEAAGGRYVDVAVMAPVNPQKLSVPLLLSGAEASGAVAALKVLGFSNARIVGRDVGRASTIKMLRSVMYKGVEALTAECLIACERAGVTDEVLGSFGNDWATSADYRFDRMLVHGLRRAAELREVCKALADLGFEPSMSRGTVAWQQALGELAIRPVPEDLAGKLRAVANAMEGKTNA